MVDCPSVSRRLSTLMASCLSPIQIRNPNYEKKPNQTLYLNIPCGKCAACVERKQKEWFIRLKQEEVDSNSIWFVTLTYNNDHLPSDLCVNKEDFQKFWDRFRKNFPPRSFKYFCVSEYGLEQEGHRPHYHFILFVKPPENLKYKDIYEYVEKSWQSGFISVSRATDARLKYVTGYCINKLFTPPDRTPVFNLISKGIGKRYLEKYKDFHCDETRFYVPYYGSKFPMPRYYKDKLFSDETKQKHCKKMESESLEREQKKLEELGGDFGEYQRIAYYQRADFARRIRNSHKKQRQL